MDTKIIRKVASILMVMAIMSSTLATPITNVVKVMATTTEETAVSTQQVDDASVTPAEASGVSEAEVASDSSISEAPVEPIVDAPSSDTSTDDVVSEDVNVEEPAEVISEPTTNEPASSSENTSANVDSITNDSTSSSEVAKDVTAASAKVADKPAEPEAVVPPELCPIDQNNPPWFGDVTQVANTNNFIIEYAGGGGTPNGYTPTAVTFYSPSDIQDANPDDIILGPIAVENGNFDFSGGSGGSNAITTTIAIPPDNVDVLIHNLKSNGQTGIKYIVTYETPNGDCIRKSSDTKHVRFAPFFPTPTLLAAQNCNNDCIVDLSFDYDITKFPTGAEVVILQDGEEVHRAPIGLHEFAITVDDFLAHDYEVYIDLYSGTESDDFNPHSTPISFTLLEKPMISDLTAVRVANNIQVDFNVDLNGYSGASVFVELDGVKIPVSLIGGVVNQLLENVGPGMHEIRVVVDYGVDCEVATNIIPVTIYPAPILSASQDCNKDCVIDFVFDYAVDDYPDGSEVVLLKDGEEVFRGDVGVFTHSLQLLGDFDEHTYSIYIDTHSVPENNPQSMDVVFELLKKPEISNLVNTNVGSNDINAAFDVDLNDYLDAMVSIKLDDGSLVNVTDLIVDGHISYDFINVTPGEHTITVVISYGEDCPDVVSSDTIIVPDFEIPTIMASQDCNKDCIIDFEFGYSVEDYPDGSEVVLLKDGEEVFRGDIGVFTHSLQLLNDFDEHTYSIYIDTHLGEEFNPVSNSINFELLQKPEIMNLTNTIVGSNDLNATFDVDLHDYTDAIVSIKIDDGALIDVTDLIMDGFISYDFQNITPGEHSITVVVSYGEDCPDVISSDTIVVPNFEIPTIMASQDCNKDCIIDFEFGYSVDDYPEGSEVVLLKDGEEVFRGSVGIFTHSLQLLNDFDSHEYVLYIDTHLGEEFNPVSESINFELLQKPEIMNLANTLVGSNNLNATFDVNLHDYADAMVSIKLDDGSLIDVTDLIFDGSVSYDFINVTPGEHFITVVISYGEDCPDVVDTTMAPVPDFEIPTIMASQDCNKVCIVDLAFGYEIAKYPVGSEVVVLQDGIEVFRGEIGVFALEFNETDFDSHEYALYIDTHLGEEFNPVSEPVNFELLQKPEVMNLVTSNVGSNDINVEFDVNVHDYADAMISVQLDDGSLVDVTDLIMDGTVSYDFINVTPGEHAITVVVSYGEDCPDIIATTMHVVPDFEIPTIMASQDCKKDCIVDLAFGYDIDDYPMGSEVVVLQDGIEVFRGDSGVFNLSLQLLNDFDSHEYIVYIDAHLGEEFNAVSSPINFELLQKPEVMNLVSNNVGSNDINVEFDVDLHDYADAMVSVQLDDGSLVDVTEIISEGHVSYNFVNATPGEHNILVIISYGEDCPDVVARIVDVVPEFPVPTLFAAQDCRKDCIVDLAFDYDIADYPAASELVILQDGLEVFRGPFGTFNRELTVNDFNAHDYSIYIDTHLGEEFNPVSSIVNFELLQKPELLSFIANKLVDANDINVDFNIDAHDYIDAQVFIEIDGVKTLVELGSEGVGSRLFEALEPGEHIIRLIIEYGEGCPAIVSQAVTVPVFEAPIIEASQDCNKDCIVDVALGYDADTYPENAEVVVLQDGEEVLRYMVSDDSHRVASEDIYNYELTVEDFLSHTYSVYIDTKLGEEFDPYSEEIEFTLLQKPEITAFEMMKNNNNNTITIDYEAILHDYADAVGMITITGPSGYSKTINIDSMDLASGSYTTEKLVAGTYNATFTINYGEDCAPVILDAEPVKIEEPKLVYTGLETNFFESILLSIRDIVISI